jgi:hypothetical protein
VFVIKDRVEERRELRGSRSTYTHHPRGKTAWWVPRKIADGRASRPREGIYLREFILSWAQLTSRLAPNLCKTVNAGTRRDERLRGSGRVSFLANQV